MTILTTIVQSVIDDLLRSDGEATPLAVETLVYDNHADEFYAEIEQLARRRVRSIAKSLLKDTARAKDESFPGLDLPRTFTVPTEGGFRYVATHKATVADVLADLAVKRENLARCTTEVKKATALADRLTAVATPDTRLTDTLGLLAVPA